MDRESKRFELAVIKSIFKPEYITLIGGQTLFTEGEDNDYVYFIESGSIKVLKSKWLIGITKANEFVGITSCLSEGMQYSFTAKATENSKVLKITKSDFKNQLLKNPAFSRQIIEILCERIKLTDKKTRSFIEHSSKHRLISEIINNSKQVENSLKAILGEDDLAELTGVSKRSVRKLLNTLKKENLIEQNENEIILLDKEKLRSLSKKSA